MGRVCRHPGGRCTSCLAGGAVPRDAGGGWCGKKVLPSARGGGFHRGAGLGQSQGGEFRLPQQQQGEGLSDG
jgi:hypothetical protein